MRQLLSTCCWWSQRARLGAYLSVTWTGDIFAQKTRWGHLKMIPAEFATCPLNSSTEAAANQTAVPQQAGAHLLVRVWNVSSLFSSVTMSDCLLSRWGCGDPHGSLGWVWTWAKKEGGDFISTSGSSSGTYFFPTGEQKWLKLHAISQIVLRYYSKAHHHAFICLYLINQTLCRFSFVLWTTQMIKSKSWSTQMRIFAHLLVKYVELLRKTRHFSLWQV